MKAKVNNVLAKPPSLHLFQNVPQVHNLDCQFMAVAAFLSHFLAPPTCHGNKATSSATLTAVASFSGHFQAPLTWPGKEATSPPLQWKSPYASRYRQCHSPPETHHGLSM